MAMLEVFAIYDNKARAFNVPFFMQNQDVALRAFKQVVNDPTTQISKSPSDFELFHLGRYDDATAKFDLGSLNSLGLAANFKE